jgi:FAD/FMN-containing dehydrogenase
MQAALERIRKLLGDDNLSTDPGDLETYGRDWTRVWQPAPCAVARPGSTEQVAEVVKICAAEGLAVVPSGGRTGLAGGAVAKDGELVLSLERIHHLGEVDEFGGTVVVGAGAVTQTVHDHVGQSGWFWPIDLAAKGSSQIGGNLSTNAGGVRVIRYGHTRQWVLGLRVVTASGEILELGGALEKNNTGADLRQVFIGTEGTLGIITEATLKLTRQIPEVSVLLFAVDGIEAAMAVFAAAQRSPLTLMAFEFFTDKCAARLEAHRGKKPPLEQSSPCYVLIEVEGGMSDELLEWTEAILERDEVADGTVAQSRQQAAELWELREGISESLSATGLPHKNDVSVAVGDVASFCAELETLVSERYPGWEVCLFGHVGDGNVHVNVMKPDELDADEFHRLCHDADAAIFELVERYRGSISAEHGIGLLKRDFLHYSRSPEEIAALRALKQAFDPRGILNPGKILG